MGRFDTPEEIIFVCTGSKCAKRGGKDCYKSLKSYVKGLKDRDLEIIKIECTDRCKFAPVLNFQPKNIWLKEYTEKDVIRLLES